MTVYIRVINRNACVEAIFSSLANDKSPAAECDIIGIVLKQLTVYSYWKRRTHMVHEWPTLVVGNCRP